MKYPEKSMAFLTICNFHVWMQLVLMRQPLRLCFRNMVSWPQGAGKKTNDPDAVFTSQKWQVSGNVICVVPAESLHDDSHPEYDHVAMEGNPQQILVRVSLGKFAALQRSFDVREAPAGFLEDSNLK